jgi:hypothetical protein
VPRRELSHPRQVEEWLIDWGSQISQPASLILIGSGGLLWHAFQRGVLEPLPENSMDVDPVTDSEELVRMCYQAIIGSDFEEQHGWHVNLMPDLVLREFPSDWRSRSSSKAYDLLQVVVPSPGDLFIPKRKRNEPRDRVQEAWAKRITVL